MSKDRVDSWCQETCDNCEYFFSHYTIGKDICKRFPPDHKNRYSNVMPDDNCGEFQKATPNE